VTQEEIIELARESGMELYGLGKNRARFVHHLQAFAKLVAEKVNADWSETNERLIKVFNEKADLAYLSGAKEEREACAGLCDRFANRMMSAEECADAIRERGQP
jgi:hypothetical protein